MINRIFNRSMDYLTALPGIERKWVNRLKGKVSCLLYHRVEDYGEQPFLDKGGSPVISVKDFERELVYLKQLPTQFYTLAQLSRGQFPDKDTIGIVICFDDCFKCNYTQGLELLKKHSISAVFFQCSGFIGSSNLNWEHLLYWLYHNPSTQSALLQRFNLKNNPNEQPLTYIRENIDSKFIEEQTQSVVHELGLADEIKALAEQLYPSKQQILTANHLGMEIGSHGHNHYKRETISDELFDTDLQQSKINLSEILGHPPIAYSYPFNSYTSVDHERVRQYYQTIANVEFDRIDHPVSKKTGLIPRLTWPGVSSNQYRMKRWLLTGKF